jgi:glycosyltransferase involved in cell wall biosynthesis
MIQSIVISLMHRNAQTLGGQEIRWGRLANELSKDNNYNIKILVTDSILNSWLNYGINNYNKINFVVYRESKNKYLTWIGAQLFALKHIKKNSLIQVPGPGWLITPAVVFCKYFLGCKLITSLTTSRLKPLKKNSYREYLVSLLLCKNSTLIDCLNPEIDLDGLIDKKLINISPCSFSDPIKFAPKLPKKNKVVFAGHLQRNKGAHILLEILKSLNNNIDFDFHICGSDSNNEGYLSQIEDLQLTNSRIFISRPSEMAPIYTDAKVFLSLQIWDNYPSQSLIEAMLSGCCVVATDTGDTNLLVKNTWGERLKLEDDVQNYIQKIKYYLELPNHIQIEYGLNARDFILKNHNIEIYTNYLKNIWEKAISIQQIK